MKNGLSVSMQHHIRINEQDIFSFLITCVVLEIFTVLKYIIYFKKREMYFKLPSRIYSNFTQV